MASTIIWEDGLDYELFECDECRLKITGTSSVWTTFQAADSKLFHACQSTCAEKVTAKHGPFVGIRQGTHRQ